MFHLMLLLAAMFVPFFPREGGPGGSNGDPDPDPDPDDPDPDDPDPDDPDPDDPDDHELAAEVTELAKEMGISIGQLKGRIEASRKWERRAKSNAEAKKELDRLRKEGLSDHEKAIEEAREAARTEVLAEVASERVEAAVRVEAAGKLMGDALDTFVEGLNHSKFLDDDGDVDTDKVKALVEAIPAGTADDDPDKGKKRPATGQGRRKGKTKASVSSGRDLYAERHPTTKKE